MRRLKRVDLGVECSRRFTRTSITASGRIDFNPSRLGQVWCYPDGDDQVFVSRDLSWGIYAIFQHRGPESSGLRVFGSSLLEAFGDEWPAGWPNIVERSDD